MNILEKLFITRGKLADYKVWFYEVMYDALYTGEQFVKDHGRPMTYEEKKKWVESKERIMETRGDNGNRMAH